MMLQSVCKRHHISFCNEDEGILREWELIGRAHSFPRQILLNSAVPFAKFRGSPRQILGIPRLTAAAHYRLHCADFGPFMYLTNRLMNQRSSSSTKVQ